jgi:hypothetical protein
MSKKIAFAITLITIMFASTFVVLPAFAMAEEQFLDWDGSANDERQVAVPGILFDEMFPEYNATYWQKNSLTVGFTEYGETVTDQDPLGEGSEYGVGLTYPSVPADPFDPDMENIYVVEHIATPTISGGPSPGGLIYIPVEGWQLFWKWQEGTVGHTIDPWWHVSMAIYGNHSAPYGTRARLDVKLASELGYEPQGAKVITDTSRLFALKTHFYTYNETLLTELALDPVVFEIELIYVFFKNTKKLVQFWTIQYLRSEYGAVDVVFRRLTDWSVDNKFQDYQNENFACFFPHSAAEPGEYHAFWPGCDYWPQNFSLGLAWTNRTISHWDPDDAQHHVGFIAYYPNCSNWDTDNWNWYLTNIWTQWRNIMPQWKKYVNGWDNIVNDPDRKSLYWDEGLTPDTNVGCLTTRFDGQPTTYEYQEYVSAAGVTRFAASPLMLGQWNFTLTSATADRMAKFVNVMGVTNCSDRFGYVGNAWSGDWDSEGDQNGAVTMTEIKYLLAECFNASYKLSSNHWSSNDLSLDMANWYPFSGVSWLGGKVMVKNNSFVDPTIGYFSGPAGEPTIFPSPRNTTFIYGDSVSHNGMVFTSEGSHVVDVVGGTEVAMDFGAYVGPPSLRGNNQVLYGDPWFEAMWDTVGFMGESPGPFPAQVGAPDYFFEQTQETYLDPLPSYSPVGPISTDLQKTAIRRMSHRQGPEGDQYFNYFTTPTGCGWNLSHIVAVGGPKVNLATEYANEHTWAIWTSAESGTEFEDLEDGGIYVFPSGNYYVGDGWSVITIVDDLNLTSWTALADNDFYVSNMGNTMLSNTDGQPSTDGPTLVEPYAILAIWGMSGWDTRAACNWLAQYRQFFNPSLGFDATGLATNATLQPDTGLPKLGVTTIILNTDAIADVCDDGWMNGVQEILGPVAGRWRLSESAWNVWIDVPVSIDW